MGVSKVFDASPEKILETVRTMVREDCAAATDVSPDEVEVRQGMSYTKRLVNRMGRDERATVTVTRLDEGGYEATFSSRYGVNGIAYAFSAHDGGTMVTYEETFSGGTTASGLSHKVFSFLTGRGNKKRMRAQLDAFERAVLQR